jgi:hypothetical protein
MDDSISENQNNCVRYYFVDEAGDPTLFSRRGRKSLIGTEGCSTFFILGLLEVRDPQSLTNEMAKLHQELMADPYLSSIPSMQPAKKKTALMFHANNDCPEVRREMFKLLMKHQLKFFALVRDKRRIAELVLEQNKKDAKYRYHPNQLYDRCVSRLFKERLHKDAGYAIHFAKRGSKDRTTALRSALEQSRNNLRKTWGIISTAPIEVKPCVPEHEAGLQAVDYFLWALQRLYEREEERYWDYILPAVSLVHDVDDIREREYGVYYTKSNLLTLASKKQK